MNVKSLTKRFFDWYERYYIVNVSIAVGLFLLQLVHLYWMGANVVATRLVGHSFFELQGIWQAIIVLIDYTEIPAIIATSLVYINEYRKTGSAKSLIYLAFLNSQWLHMFWITDEFVVEQFIGHGGVALPTWLAWLAIMIDFLELPVIYDTIRKLQRAIRDRDIAKVKEALKE